MQKMDSNFIILFVLMALTTSSVLLLVGASDQFRVGDDQGWREPDSNHTDLYNLWAGSIRFRVGDSIYFEYTNDSVVLVNKRGYYHCNTTNSTQVFNDGKTLFTLDKPGPFYFVSGDADHCKHGQRLIIDVMTPHPPSIPPQPPSQPPASLPAAPSPSPLPSTATSSAPFGAMVVVLVTVAVMPTSKCC